MDNGDHGETEHPPAVEGRGIFFYYDRKKEKPILNDANICVRRGVIYGLLGPSGCGKTTLLKCIVGRKKPSRGSVLLYGKTPGQSGFFIPGHGVGFMPQDISLYIEISTQETLTYFAKLYKMDRKTTEKRIAFLIDLLKLPDKNENIKNLSGGQQRRVSFAVALIHKPPLLILDEPTVGVDPLLRQTIWNHLVTLAKEDNLTIIVTTHYIEEARQANVVGMMRNGHLLAEMNPEFLIKQYNAPTLETVFLQLCKHDDDDDDETKFSCSSQIQISCSSIPETKSPSSTESDEILLENVVSRGKVTLCKGDDLKKEKNCNSNYAENTKALLESSSTFVDTRLYSGRHLSRLVTCVLVMTALIQKNLLRLRRKPMLLFLEMTTPLLQVLLFCLCVGGPPFDLTVAVVNLDTEPSGLGQLFLESISNDTILLEHYSDITLARESVKSGKSWAALYIGPDFSACMLKRIAMCIDVDNDTINCSTIEVNMDMSNKQISLSLYAALVRDFQEFSRNMLGKMQKNPHFTELPLALQEPTYGDRSLNFTEFLIPGVIVSNIFILAMGLTTIAIILEGKHGLMERTYIAGVTPVEVILSFFLSVYITMIAQVALLLIFTFLVFNIPFHGPFIWIVICLILSGTCGMSYGFLISTLFEDEIAAMMMAMGTFFPLFIMSGIIWPLEAMNYYSRYICYGLPFALICDSLRSIMSRGWNITEYHTWDGFLVTLAWSIGFMTLACILLRKQS